MEKLVYTTVRLSRDVWKSVNSEREPNETLDECLKRIINDRKMYRRMVKTAGGDILT